MKVLGGPPPGLKGAIGTAAGLLNAAMRSRNELGFSATAGGGALVAGAAKIGFEAGGGFEVGGRFCGKCGDLGVLAEGGDFGEAWDFVTTGISTGGAIGFGGSGSSCLAGVVSCGISGVGGCTGVAGVSRGLCRDALFGRGGGAGSNFSTKFLGNKPSFFVPLSSMYSPKYQSASSSSVTVMIWP